MIEITFKDFYEYKYREDGEEGFELYVMKNGLDDILYVGISRSDIWNRWFGWNGHIRATDKFMTGESSVGQKIVDHLPDSWDWKIQLWTLSDCVAFCADEINPHGRYTIQMVEPFMIYKLYPVLNATCNPNPGINHMPKSEKEKQREAELDRVFREVFEKNSKWRTK